jgi:hypothetical protein
MRGTRLDGRVEIDTPDVSWSNGYVEKSSEPHPSDRIAELRQLEWGFQGLLQIIIERTLLETLLKFYKIMVILTLLCGSVCWALN